MTGFEILHPAPSQQACLRAPSSAPNFQFERQDWTLFRSVSTLGQKAGVSPDRLRRLVLKELADNALDTGCSVQVGYLAGGGYFVQDDGPGLGETPESLARLFSIGRPLASSKLLRLPTRGALGNGLRVVAGAVLASDGSLEVATSNQRHHLVPLDDGTTAVISKPAVFPTGTRIEISLGEAIPADPEALLWARQAIAMARGETYRGKTSPHWYDAAAFFELFQAAAPRPVRDMIATLDGCTGAVAGKIAATFKGRLCGSLSRRECSTLLSSARAVAKPVTPKRLGAVGPEVRPTYAYTKMEGTVTIGHSADILTIPSVVEAWVTPSEESSRPSAWFYINRTPITGSVSCWQEKWLLQVYGCGLNIEVDAGKVALKSVINVATPYMPITTDGKEPDFKPFSLLILAAIEKAAKVVRRSLKSDELEPIKRSHKDIVLDQLAEAIDKVSGNGEYRFNQRQLYYVIRPQVQQQSNRELNWGNFCQIITDYEAENGEIEGMFRDPRGTLYHPHTGEDIALGSLAVEEYRRPEWSFNKILYIEKEGFFEILKSVQWPERHDCALLSSKGYATRAVRDIIDLLAEDDEPVTVFCIHDADASGTMIYQTLQEATKARGRRRVEIINLGLEPWEALELGLEVEVFEAGKDRRSVATYVEVYAGQWSSRLQSNRVELNALTTEQFLKWLDDKIATHSPGKVIPPEHVIAESLRTETSNALRARIETKILEEAGVDHLIANALETICWPDNQYLLDTVERCLHQNSENSWTHPVKGVAAELAHDWIWA